MQISELLAQVQHHHDEAHAEIERLRRENELQRNRWVMAERNLNEVTDSIRHENMRLAAQGVKDFFASRFPQCGHVVFPAIRDLSPGTHLVRLVVIEEQSGCTLCGLPPAGHLHKQP